MLIFEHVPANPSNMPLTKLGSQLKVGVKPFYKASNQFSMYVDQ
jgi:hypothetical protein